MSYISIEIFRFLSLLFLSICKSLLYGFGVFIAGFLVFLERKVGVFEFSKLFLFTESECRICYITSVSIEVKGFLYMGKTKMWFFLLLYTAEWEYILKNVFIQLIHKQRKNIEKNIYIVCIFFSFRFSCCRSNNSVLIFWYKGLRVKTFKIQTHLKDSLN